MRGKQGSVMPDWAVVLVAAFGGGLAGAVLQPLVAHVLQRVTAKEEIRRNRKRRLRRMVESQMRAASMCAAIAHMVLAGSSSAKISEQVEKGLKYLYDAKPEPWHPERITDPALRDVAERYNETIRALLHLMSTSGDHRGAQELLDSLQALSTEMNRRMDELNWPEVDD